MAFLRSLRLSSCSWTALTNPINLLDSLVSFAHLGMKTGEPIQSDLNMG